MGAWDFAKSVVGGGAGLAKRGVGGALTFTRATGAAINPFDNGRGFGDVYRDDRNKTYLDRVQSQDPNAVSFTMNGVQYNFAGDPIGRDPGYNQANGSTSSNNDQAIFDLQAELRALRNSQPYVPKLPEFDILGNYTRAKNKAESQVNPLYEKKLTDFLQNQTRKITQRQNAADLERSGVAAELQALLDANNVSRTRTNEDVNQQIADINYQEGNFQKDEGQVNEAERQALIQDIASAGLTTSGLGRQRVADQQRIRNTVSERQIKAFNDDRDARELYRTRTFEDLATSDVLAQGQATRKNQGIDLDLEAYMDDLAYEEKLFRVSNELERGSAVLNAAEANRRSGVDEFIGSLINSGRRAEDIQLARSVYL